MCLSAHEGQIGGPGILLATKIRWRRGPRGSPERWGGGRCGFDGVAAAEGAPVPEEIAAMAVAVVV